MNKWTKVQPNEPGWYWVKSDKFFSRPTPVEVRIVKINQLCSGKCTRVEFWNPKKSEWTLADSIIELWQKVDNQPLNFSKR